MSVLLARSVIAGLLSAAVLGCGSESTLLADTDAAGLKDRLEQVRSAVDARDCDAATARLRELRSSVSDLDGSVDRRLRVRLGDEIDGKLAPAVQAECDDSKTEAVPTTTTEAPTEPTEPIEPDPTPSTETEPPPETPTVTVPVPPAETEPPPAEPAPEAPVPDPGGFGEGAG